MPQAFENLMVSSPNGGGLLFIHGGQVFRLDDFNTTGISLNGDQFLRGFQPEGLVFYQGIHASDGSGISIDDIHDVLIVGSSLYAVGTSANEVLQLDMNVNPVCRWSLPGDIDAKHINCLALWSQRIVFSAFGDFTQHRQYKGHTSQAGFVQDVQTGERLIEGLSQPHSLVPFGDKLLLANSETRELREYDGRGKLLRSKTLDGYTRGICIQGNILYVGLSRSRNTDSSAIVNANLVALDLQSWEELDRIELPISEIYSVLPIDDTDALPAVLAGISQRAAIDYRHAINTRDEQITDLKSTNERLRQMEASLTEHLDTRNKQYDDHIIALNDRDEQITDLINTNERLRQMEASLTEHLDTRNKQYDDHVIALTERDAHIIELNRAREALVQEREHSTTLRADDSFKLAQSQLRIEKLEADLQENAQQCSTFQERASQLAEQLQETGAQLHLRDQQTQILSSAKADAEHRIAELSTQHQLTQLQLNQAINELLIEKQQLQSARVFLADVTQEKDGQLEALRATLAERDAQLSVISQRLAASEQVNGAMVESRSWRWTRPLRDFRRQFMRF